MKGLSPTAQANLNTVCREFRVRPRDALSALLEDVEQVREAVSARLQAEPPSVRPAIRQLPPVAVARRSKYGFDDMELGKPYLIEAARDVSPDSPIHCARSFALRRGLGFGWRWESCRRKVWIWFTA